MVKTGALGCHAYLIRDHHYAMAHRVAQANHVHVTVGRQVDSSLKLRQAAFGEHGSDQAASNRGQLLHQHAQLVHVVDHRDLERLLEALPASGNCLGGAAHDQFELALIRLCEVELGSEQSGAFDFAPPRARRRSRSGRGSGSVRVGGPSPNPAADRAPKRRDQDNATHREK